MEVKELTRDDGYSPSKYRVFFVCPVCQNWQVDVGWGWRVQNASRVNEVLKEHLLECA